MSVDPCYKKDDLLLETITDAMQDVAIKTRAPDYEDDMAVSQVRDLLCNATSHTPFYCNFQS